MIVDIGLRVPRGPHADTRLCGHTRGGHDSVREELASALTKKGCTYQPRVVGEEARP